MASMPQFYSNQQSDFSDFTTNSYDPVNGMNCSSVMEENTMWADDDHRYGFVPLLDDNNSFGTSAALFDPPPHHTVPSLSMHYYSDPWSPPPAFPLAVPEVSDVRSSHHHNSSFYGINNNDEGFHQNLSSGLLYQQPYINGDFGDECCGFVVEDVKPLSCPNNKASSTGNWGVQGNNNNNNNNNNNQVLGVDQENIKVGRYSEEERKERILRYLRKRNQRNFNKTIKYACRKTLADRRVRVRGRFARNNELCEDEITMKKNIDNLQPYDLYSADDSFQFQLRNEEEDWLQEAMESLVFLSHSSSSSPKDI